MIKCLVQSDGFTFLLEFEPDYVQGLVEQSEIDLGRIPVQGAQIFTLSTCSYEEWNERLVIHAYLLEEISE